MTWRDRELEYLRPDQPARHPMRVPEGVLQTGQGVESAGDQQEQPEARESVPAPSRVSGEGTTATKELATVQDAAQAIVDGVELDYGEVTVKVQGGRAYLIRVTHQLKPEDAGKVKL